MPADASVPSGTGRLRLTVDGRAVAVPEGTSVLRAAELAGVQIPSLCAHRELSPYGGCRLCAVDIAGMSGHPLACSTPAQDGMQVTTDGESLGEMRREILQLILSVHPSSCLFCDEADACARSQTTIRKAGVSTGCRSCPADGDCELQRVVKQVGVTEIDHPIAYRGHPPEHDDPFYDRDYNICILCGRCVRMCREVRGTSVLEFNYRSRRVKIGPAFGRSHIEAGCEFCGACISVCPTGALAHKVSKWDGIPDGVETSTCPFCGIGCRLELRHKAGSLSEASGAHDPEINDGQLCVRGRFCLPEATHHPARARKPMLRRGAHLRVEDWDVALAEVADRLAACGPGEFLMLVSPDLTNESLYAAQRFAREAMRSGGIDSSGGEALPGGPVMWSRLFSLPISLLAIAEADAVIGAGLAARYSFSVAAVQARRAARRGARLVVVDARESSLARAADVWVPTAPGAEAMELTALLEMLDDAQAGRGNGPAKGRLGDAVRLLAGIEKLAVIVGPRVFYSLGAERLAPALEKLATRGGVTVLPLACGANVRAMLELGALAGVGPGPRPAKRRGLTLGQLRDGSRAKVLYLVGEAPFAARPDCDYLIAQDLMLPPYPVDAFLPAASFAEAEGTLTNLEGRVQELHPVEREAADAVRGYARADWWAFSELAGRLGHSGLEYDSAADVRAAIRADVPGFPAEGDRAPRRMSPLRTTGRASARASVASTGHPVVSGSTPETPAGSGRFVLVPVAAAFRHRGVDLADLVEGLGELRLEEGVRMNPGDVARLGVEPDGAVTIVLDGLDLVLAARPDPACPRGAAYISYTPAWDGPVVPVRARISAGDRARRSRRAPAAALRGLMGGEDATGR